MTSSDEFNKLVEALKKPLVFKEALKRLEEEERLVKEIVVFT